MSYYEAYQIADNDLTAMQVAIEDLGNCMPLPPNPQFVILSAERRGMELGESEVHSAFRNLNSMICRMSILPGQRVIVMMSPGFSLRFGTGSKRHPTEQEIRRNCSGIYGRVSPFIGLLFVLGQMKHFDHRP
jgi:hypothetical protein